LTIWAKIIFYPIGIFAFLIVVGGPVVKFIRKVKVGQKLRRRKLAKKSALKDK